MNYKQVNGGGFLTHSLASLSQSRLSKNWDKEGVESWAPGSVPQRGEGQWVEM